MKHSRTASCLAKRVAGPRRARVALALLATAASSLAPAACQRSGEKREAERADNAATSGESREPEPVGPPWRPGYQRPPVIDAHVHLMPSGLRRLVRIMKENGLGLVVNVQGGSPGRGLEQSVAMQQHFPGVINFYYPSWGEANVEGFGKREAARLEYAVKQAHFKGLKIEKVLGLYLKDARGRRIPVDWQELDPLWAKAGELGVPVLIHTGDPKAFWEPVTPENERYAELSVHPGWSFADAEKYPSREALLEERNRVIARHPKTTFICAHFGNNPEDLEYVDAFLDKYPNAMIDTAARIGEIGRHPADEVRAFFVKHETRILFGTDLGLSDRGLMLGSSGETPPTMADVKPFYDAHWRFFEGSEKGIPHPTPIQGDWTVDAIGLPDDVLDALYFGNAMRLFGLAVADP